MVLNSSIVQILKQCPTKDLTFYLLLHSLEEELESIKDNNQLINDIVAIYQTSILSVITNDSSENTLIDLPIDAISTDDISKVRPELILSRTRIQEIDDELDAKLGAWESLFSDSSD